MSFCVSLELRVAWRRAEQRIKALVRHREPVAIIEIIEIEPERPIGFEIDEMIANELRIAGLAIRREAHELVFAGIHLEAGVIGERRIQQAEAMWKMNLLVNSKFISFADRHRGRRPFTNAIERQHGGTVERRGIKSGSRVAQMVLAKQQPLLPIEVRLQLPQLTRDE